MEGGREGGVGGRYRASVYVCVRACMCVLTFHLSSRERVLGGNSWLNSGSQKDKFIETCFSRFRREGAKKEK